jgi:class 3 adenylate cyclase
MKDPLASVECRSKFIRPFRLSFEIVLPDDIINVSYSHIPKKTEPWYGNHESSKYGSGLTPLYNVKCGPNATPLAIAEELCRILKAGEPKEVRNIQTNYVDLHIPKFIELGPVAPNYPERPTRIERVVGYGLFADLREFSKWSLTAEPEQVSDVYEVISDRVAQMLIDYPFSYWKLLGDGIMLVWEVGESESDSADCAIGAGNELHKKYWYYRKEALSSVPIGFGIAICGGHLTKFSSSTFFESCIVNDYLGPTVNQAARLQALAEPGQVLVNRRVAKMSAFDWYSFENITDSLADRLSQLKGISEFETEVFKVRHKYFNLNWESFCI